MFNYQILWEQQDQNAYINFPQVLTETKLLPFIISDTNKHVHYRDPTSPNISHLELINLDNHRIVEDSEISDNRPYTHLKSFLKPRLTNIILISYDMILKKILHNFI